jgi:hypothetical protein
MKCEHEPCRLSKRAEGGRRGIQKHAAAPTGRRAVRESDFGLAVGARSVVLVTPALTDAVSMNVGRALSPSGVFGPPDPLPFPPFYRRSAARETLLRCSRFGAAPFGLFERRSIGSTTRPSPDRRIEGRWSAIGVATLIAPRPLRPARLARPAHRADPSRRYSR